jgi:hypothetical protein
MDVLRITAVAFLLLVIICSGFLCAIIHRYISNKAPVQTTTIDLIYKDCVVYIFAMTVSISTIFICCLSTDNFTLSYSMAVALTNIVYFIFECGCVSMLISSFLQLLTMLRNSEEARIQLLGNDDKAIAFVRGTSVIFSLILALVMILVLETVPPAVNSFTDYNNLSAAEVFKKSPSAQIYFVIPYLALASNILTYLVSQKITYFAI